MEEIYCSRIGEVEKNKGKLEKELGVKISIVGEKVLLEGSGLEEYEARLVFEAIDFGFTVKHALALADEEMLFRKIRIKDYTRRSLEEVKSRIIGIKGKARRTMEKISGCKILVRENEVGVIGSVEDADNVVTAIIHIIRGSKQANMYAYLERMNRVKKI
jgi:KH domain-containing protein